MSAAKGPTPNDRSSRRPTKHRVPWIFGLVIPLAIPLAVEIDTRRQARALFAPFLEGPAWRADEPNSSAELEALSQLEFAPRRLREAFFGVVFSDPGNQRFFLGSRRAILDATLRQHSDRRELLVKIIDRYCYRGSEVDFYRVCWRLIRQLPRDDFGARSLPGGLGHEIADRLIRALVSQPPDQWDYLSRYLKSLGKELPNVTARKAAERLVDRALAGGESFGPQELLARSQAFEKLEQPFNGPTQRRAVDRVIAGLDGDQDRLEPPGAAEVDELLLLSRAVADLGETVDSDAGDRVVERVVDVILRTRDTALIFRLHPALEVLGRQLSAVAAERGVARMVQRMLDTGDANQLDFRSRALGALGGSLTVNAADRAAAPIVEGIAAARDLNQVVFLARSLKAFRERPDGTGLSSPS